MLNTLIPNRSMPSHQPWSETNAAPFQWLPSGITFVRRRLRPLVGCALIGVTLGAAFFILVPSQYTAVAILNIDSSRANPVGGQPMISDWQTESAYIDSQVALIESPATLRGVVTQLNLDHNPLFAPQVIGTNDPNADRVAQGKAEITLSHMLDVWRVGATSVVEVKVHTRDPALSAKLANAVTQAYMAQQLLAISDTTAQAGTWLQSRVGTLRAQAVSADRAVQEYKAKHNIADVASGAGTGLIDEQQLGALNVELANARARVALAKAHYEQAQTDTTSGINKSVTTDIVPNSIMAGLQQQYLDAVRKEADLTSRVGPKNATVILQHKVVVELQQSIQSEMTLELANYHADYVAAMADESTIQSRLNEEIATEAQANIQLSELRSLQSSAEAYRSIYQNFLQRFTQAMQDQSYPIANARVAATALPPTKHSFPKGSISLAVGLALGLIIGILIAVVQEALDGSVRTVTQLRSATALDYLGSISESSTLAWNRAQYTSGTSRTDRSNFNHRISLPSAFRQATLNPASGMADAVQSVRIAATRQSTRGREVHVIGCVSVAADEGCSTFAANLALALAADGQRTVLVDWNCKSPGLTNMLFSQRHPGLQELLAGQSTLADATECDMQTKLSFIGQSANGRISVQPGPAKIQAILAELRNIYDIVVLDLPPLQAGNTAMQISDWVDGFVLITRWGTTSQTALREALSLPSSVDAIFLGAVLNRCDPTKMSLYPGNPAPMNEALAPLPAYANA